jgi:hypothetical protein
MRMNSPLKLVSCAGVVAAGLALASLPSSPVSAQPQPKQPPAPAAQPSGVSEADCREALDQVRQLKRQIGGFEKRLDVAQQQLNAAKGEARVDALVKIVNEMADDRRQIDSKMALVEALQTGHLMAHIRDAKSLEDLQHDLRRCVLALHLQRIASAVEDDDLPSTPAGTSTPKK